MSEDGSINDPHTEWIDKVKADDPDTYEKMEKVYHSCRDSKFGTLKFFFNSNSLHFS